MPAQMIVVLAGDFSGNRIVKAGDLVRAGFAPKILVSGPAGMYGEYESEAAIRYAVRQGYPESWFVPSHNQAHSTTEEALAIDAQLRAWNITRVDIVTSDYHTRRASAVYRRLAPELSFRMVAAPDLYFSTNRWWRNREGQKTVFLECSKTVANWFRL